MEWKIGEIGRVEVFRYGRKTNEMTFRIVEIKEGVLVACPAMEESRMEHANEFFKRMGKQLGWNLPGGASGVKVIFDAKTGDEINDAPLWGVVHKIHKVDL